MLAQSGRPALGPRIAPNVKDASLSKDPGPRDSGRLPSSGRPPGALEAAEPLPCSLRLSPIRKVAGAPAAPTPAARAHSLVLGSQVVEDVGDRDGRKGQHEDPSGCRGTHRRCRAACPSPHPARAPRPSFRQRPRPSAVPFEAPRAAPRPAPPRAPPAPRPQQRPLGAPARSRRVRRAAAQFPEAPQRSSSPGALGLRRGRGAAPRNRDSPLPGDRCPRRRALCGKAEVRETGAGPGRRAQRAACHRRPGQALGRAAGQQKVEPDPGVSQREGPGSSSTWRTHGGGDGIGYTIPELWNLCAEAAKKGSCAQSESRFKLRLLTQPADDPPWSRAQCVIFPLLYQMELTPISVIVGSMRRSPPSTITCTSHFLIGTDTQRNTMI